MENNRGLKLLKYLLGLIIIVGIVISLFVFVKSKNENKYTVPNYQMK